MNETIDSLIDKTGLTHKELAEKMGVNERTVYRWANLQCEPKPLVVREIKKLAELANARILEKPASKFKFIDLFAGIGGFRKAFDSIGGECVFTSEWDKKSRMTYMANYSCDHPVVGDIREFTHSNSALSTIPEHDVLVAGFPCQPFSLAGVSKKNSLGKQHGFECTTQGTLFFDIAKILEYHRPKAFLLENVKNLRSHDKGNTFKIIQETLVEELGYNIQFRILDGRHWVPQHRERIFIVGFDRDYGFDFNDLKLPVHDEMPTLDMILHSKIDDDEPPFFTENKVGEKYTLSPKLWNYLQEYKKKHQAKGNGFGFGLFSGQDVARTLSARYHKDGSEILIQQKNTRPRRLTPRECARIMGFDKKGESNFNIPVSDTQAYRQFGNSVIVPVAKSVAEAMLPYIVEAVSVPANQKNIFESKAS